MDVPGKPAAGADRQMLRMQLGLAPGDPCVVEERVAFEAPPWPRSDLFQTDSDPRIAGRVGGSLLSPIVLVAEGRTGFGNQARHTYP